MHRAAKAEIEQASHIRKAGSVAYIKGLFLVLIGLAIMVIISNNLKHLANTGLLLALPASLILFGIYSLIYTSTYRVFIIEGRGVFIYRGVFPWSRGSYGINWRDFEDAVYLNGFFYWLLRCHPIVLRTRFSDNPNIITLALSDAKSLVCALNRTASIRT